MDKKRMIRNVLVSVIFKFILIFLSIFARKAVLVNLGVDATGVTSLFSSIIGFLAIAELGIGISITYCMYEPIVKGEKEKVGALYRLFKRLYLYIFIIVLVVGCALTPAIPFFCKGYEMDSNIYVLYLLTLAATLLSYSYAAGQSLVNAHKDNYITVLIESVLTIILYTIQIVVLYYSKSFYIFLVINIIKNLVEYIVTKIYVSKKYNDIIIIKDDVDEESKKQITKNVKALFLHKIGGLLANTLDSLIISTFISVSILGYYTNYTSIIISLSTLVNLVFSSLISVVGHSLVLSDKETSEKNFLFFHTLNFTIGIVIYLGYFSVVDNFIELVYGAEYIMDKTIAIVTAVNYFVQFMRQSIGLYKDASGCFAPDRYKPLIEGVINFGLSLALVFSLGVIGVVIATIFTTLTICHTVEPYVLYKYAFEKKPNKFYIKHYCLIALFGVALAIFYFIPLPTFSNKLVEFICNGFIAVGYALVYCVIVYLIDNNFRTKLNSIIMKGVRKICK